VYGIGAGGEFPVMSTRALEAAKGAESRLHRGRRVQLSFLMQGWGQLFNQVVLIVLLLAFKRGRGGPPYDETSTQWTYRLSFAAVLPFTAYVLWRRVRALRRTRAAGVSERGAGYDVRALRMVVRHYWPRLLATMGGWFLMDFVYYVRAHTLPVRPCSC
jgi:MFS family permease